MLAALATPGISTVSRIYHLERGYSDLETKLGNCGAQLRRVKLVMQMDHAESLRLVAKDEVDLEVVSALLQDAIIAGADMHYDAQHDCFMIVANRFVGNDWRWLI